MFKHTSEYISYFYLTAHNFFVFFFFFCIAFQNYLQNVHVGIFYWLTNVYFIGKIADIMWKMNHIDFFWG